MPNIRDHIPTSRSGSIALCVNGMRPRKFNDGLEDVIPKEHEEKVLCAIADIDVPNSPTLADVIGATLQVPTCPNSIPLALTTKELQLCMS
jgi:hypothetical protein